MSNPYVRFFIILLIPLILGFGIGYSVKSNARESAAAVNKEFAEAFPASSVSSAVQTQEADPTSNSRKNAITKSVALISPAVVGINVMEVRTVRDPWSQLFGDDPLFRQFFGDRQ